jgi:hypothetical protein
MKRLMCTLSVAAIVGLTAGPAVAKPTPKIDRKPGPASIAAIVSASPDHTVLAFALEATRRPGSSTAAP